MPDQNHSTETEIYDLRGLNCPLPVLKTRRKLQDIASGTFLCVTTTDPMSLIDLPHFCNQEGHALIANDSDGKVYRFVIRKG